MKRTALRSSAIARRDSSGARHFPSIFVGVIAAGSFATAFSSFSSFPMPMNILPKKLFAAVVP
jgi:hypothetical protein